MPWEPSTDFEEEVVNLQPRHDFIYGVLSEPEFSYPRPKSHMEYAANKKAQVKEQNRAGKINGKLHVIQEVQRITGTKPVGEMASIDDWENNRMIEQETIGLLRYCGMGASVEQPLDPKLTIATHPVKNTIKVVKNGRRNVALFFDENVFKLKEKVSDISSSIENCNNVALDKFENIENNSVASALDSDSSFNTSLSSLSNSFNTAGDKSYSSSCVSSCRKSPIANDKSQRLIQYEKLLENISSLSLDSSESCNSNIQSSDSFKTTQNNSLWTPVLEKDDDLLIKGENWPVLPKKGNESDTNHFDNSSTSNKVKSDPADGKHARKTNFLDRFIKSENAEGVNKPVNLNSATPSQESTTYAGVTKAPKENEKKSPDLIEDFTPYYTARKMYALKRNAK